jgi:hypothetical protein
MMGLEPGNLHMPNKHGTAEQHSRFIVLKDALCFMFMKDTSMVDSSTLSDIWSHCREVPSLLAPGSLAQDLSVLNH